MDELREAARDFLRRGLKKTGWTAYRWAKEARVASTTITRPLNDPEFKYLPKADTLQKLALAAQLELPNILKPTESMDIVKVHRSIPVVGDVRAGSWERVPDEPDIREWLPMEVPGYEGVELFAVKVVGRSMDLLYQDGTYVICAPPAEAGLQVDDCVVVRRTNASDQAETTLKQIVSQADGSVVLAPRSSDPAHQEPIPVPARNEWAHAGLEILGVVLVEYRKERRGRGPLLSF